MSSKKPIQYLGLSVVTLISIFIVINLNTADSQAFTSAELRQMEIDKKIERRKNGYAKQDTPDKVKLEIAKIRKYINEDSDNRSDNYLIEAYEHAKKNKYKSSQVLNWKSRGPGNVGGRTRALIVDKADSTNNTWIAASVGGGIWKSTDQGETWANMTDTSLPNLAFSSLAQSANNPSIIYSGSGEGFGSIDAIKGAGIFKSTDGGNTWAQLASTANNTNFNYINRMTISPSNANIVVAATNTGIYKTTDGGNNWTLKLNVSSRVQDLQMTHNNFNIQYAAVNGVGIYKTTDGGENWVSISDDFGGSRIELGISRSQPSTIYASIQKIRFRTKRSIS